MAPSMKLTCCCSRREVMPGSDSSSIEAQDVQVDSIIGMNSGDIALSVDLKKDPYNIHTDEVSQELYSTFPGCLSLSTDGFFIIIQLPRLPMKPWTEIIGGVPCHFTTKTWELSPIGEVLKRRVHYFSRLLLLGDINLQGGKSDTNIAIFEQHVGEVFEYFDKANIKTIELQLCNNFIVLILENEDQILDEVPRGIMGLFCCTHLIGDMDRIQQIALRVNMLISTYILKRRKVVHSHNARNQEQIIDGPSLESLCC